MLTGNPKLDPDTAEKMEAEIPRLRRYARSLTRNPAEADDLVQNCLERAIANIDKWTPGTNLRAWLFTMQRNLFLNDVRRATRSPFEDMDEEDVLAGKGKQGTQEANIAIGDIQAAFDALSEKHRDVLMLVGVEGFMYEEAGEILGIRTGTVRSRLSRARGYLRQILETRGMDVPDAVMTSRNSENFGEGVRCSTGIGQ